jgi:hypothetical protein
MIIVRLLSPGLGWFAPPKFIPGLGAGIVMESITLKTAQCGKRRIALLPEEFADDSRNLFPAPCAFQAFGQFRGVMTVGQLS